MSPLHMEGKHGAQGYDTLRGLYCLVFVGNKNDGRAVRSGGLDIFLSALPFDTHSLIIGFVALIECLVYVLFRRRRGVMFCVTFTFGQLIFSSSHSFLVLLQAEGVWLSVRALLLPLSLI